MATKPRFEVTKDHEFQPKEKVLMIDQNGYDLWEATITQIDGSRISIHYLENPAKDEVVENTERILLPSKVNKRIFDQQERTRDAGLAEEEDEEESEESSDDEDDYHPNDSDSPVAKKPKKASPPKKGGKKSSRGHDSD